MICGTNHIIRFSNDFLSQVASITELQQGSGAPHIYYATTFQYFNHTYDSMRTKAPFTRGRNGTERFGLAQKTKHFL